MTDYYFRRPWPIVPEGSEKKDREAGGRTEELQVRIPVSVPVSVLAPVSALSPVYFIAPCMSLPLSLSLSLYNLASLSVLAPG